MEIKQKPLILVSNDDGVTAKGINELIKYLQPLGEIVVMAPDSAKSGSGCALSVRTPVQYQLLRQEPGLTIYKCTGTPTDCIKLARHLVLTRKPDLVIGGINHGDNSAVNVHYSGTMGIVIEGCINQIPSVGFSFCSHEPDIDFEPTREYIQKIVRKILEKGLPPLVCLNVNFPDTEKIKGIKICEQTDGYWEQEWDTHDSQRGYYWLSGMFINTQPNNEKNDRWALSQGYAAVTPLKVNLTAHEFIDELQHIFCD